MLNYKIINDNVIETILPQDILNEIQQWKFECDKIKNHPLKLLKQHDNVGTNKNDYQVSVPGNLIENSYWLAYTLRLSALIFGGTHRNYYLRKWDGHFDNYDIWINYAYEGNYNPEHNHAGFLSGVIYLENKNDPTVFTKNNFKYYGKKGNMLIFPSETLHKVIEQKEQYERITFAFNINKKEF